MASVVVPLFCICCVRSTLVFLYGRRPLTVFVNLSSLPPRLCSPCLFSRLVRYAVSKCYDHLLCARIGFGGIILFRLVCSTFQRRFSYGERACRSPTLGASFPFVPRGSQINRPFLGGLTFGPLQFIRIRAVKSGARFGSYLGLPEE